MAAAPPTWACRPRWPPTHDLFPVHPLTAAARAGRAPGRAPGCRAAPAHRPGHPPAGDPDPVHPDRGGRPSQPGSPPQAAAARPAPSACSTAGPSSRARSPDGALVRARPGHRRRRRPAARPACCWPTRARYAHAGHPYLGYLLRRLPAGLDRCRMVPLAALLAPGPAPRRRPALVIEELRPPGTATADLPACSAPTWSVLFGVHVRLFVRYGIALESHQQNTALVLGPGRAATAGSGCSSRTSTARSSTYQRLAAGARIPTRPDESAFADPRLLTQLGRRARRRVHHDHRAPVRGRAGLRPRPTAAPRRCPTCSP